MRITAIPERKRHPEIAMGNPKMKTLTIHGRRWGHDGNGNGCHTVTIYVDGRRVHKTPVQYEAGEQYNQTAEDWLRDNEYLPNFGTEWYTTLGTYCDGKKIPFVDVVSDVRRKRDL